MDPSSRPPESSDEPRWDEGDDAWDSDLPPAPPAYGTVLPAPPPSSEGLGQATQTRGPMSPLVLGVAFAIAAVGVGLGVWLGTGDDTDATASAPSVAQAPAPMAAAATSPPPAEPPKPAPAVVPPPPPPCPEGMVLIPGGKFFMGTDSTKSVLQYANPAHQVEVASFCIDRTEVTLGAYRVCSERGECKRAFRESEWPQGKADETQWMNERAATSPLCNENFEDHDEHPVNCVTWFQAQAFCEWRGATLPTEPQWEFAARGSDGRVYSWGDAPPDSEHMNGCGAECLAWREAAKLPAGQPSLYPEDDGFVGTAPVGSFPQGRSQAGLLDMAGNVFEWTADEHRPYADRDKPVPPDHVVASRVIRGGAFNSFMPEFADPALRFPQIQEAHLHAVGFRCARAPAQNAAEE